MKALCIIGARGGSKGLPGKNLMELAGKPLIAHSIAHAKESGCFSETAVSSDDAAILACAEKYGASAIVRPDALATDEASSLGMLQHAVREIEAKTGETYGIIALLQPTSPCRTAEDVRAAFALMQETGAEVIVSATPSDKSPYATIFERDEKTKQWRPCCVNEGANAPERRQDAPTTYDLNGAIYLWKRAAFDQNPQPFAHHVELYIMPKERSIDIDTAMDFTLAQALLTVR